METKIIDDLQVCADCLQQGMALAIPTETVYGLAANALDEKAVAQIYAIKNRPTHHPLILHFHAQEAFLSFVTNFNDELQLLGEKFWPGPMTLLLDKTQKVPNSITGNSTKVAVRIPSHPLMLQLLTMLPFPLAAPSANPYGKISPTTSRHVLDQLGGKIPYILEGGPCQEGIESTILGSENDKIVIYRLGSLGIDEIATTLGYIPEIKNEKTSTHLTSGMVKYHYAPNTPLFFLEKDSPIDHQSLYIFLFEIPLTHKDCNCTIMSKHRSMKEVAQNLYNTLHLADESACSRIFIEKPEPLGIGLAILDRLQRATAKF